MALGGLAAVAAAGGVAVGDPQLDDAEQSDAQHSDAEHSEGVSALIPTVEGSTHAADGSAFAIDPQKRKPKRRWFLWLPLLLALIAGLIALALFLDDDDDEPPIEQQLTSTSLLTEDDGDTSTADGTTEDSEADTETSVPATQVETTLSLESTLSPGSIADAIGGALREQAAVDTTGLSPEQIADAIGNALRDQ